MVEIREICSIRGNCIGVKEDYTLENNIYK